MLINWLLVESFSLCNKKPIAWNLKTLDLTVEDLIILSVLSSLNLLKSISEINNLISENIELNKNISEEIRVLSKTIANVNKKQWEQIKDNYTK